MATDRRMGNSMRLISSLLIVTSIFVGCARQPATDESTSEPRTRAPQPKGQSVSEQVFGKARISVGMTKDEVLRQIEISRDQYQPLESDTGYELYVAQPSQETVQTDNWLLSCPARTSHLVGGGSGIMLRVEFRDGKVARLVRLPWLGA